MDILTLLIGIAIGLVATWIILRMNTKNQFVARSAFEDQGRQLNQLQSQLQVAEEKMRLQLDNIQHLEGIKQQYYSIQQQFAQQSAKSDALSQQLDNRQQEILKCQQIDEQHQQAIQELRTNKQTLEFKNNMLTDQLASQVEVMESLHQKSKLEFEKMATEILEDRSKKFTEANRLNLDAIIKPLGENIEGFKKVVQATHIQETRDRASLETRVKELVQQTNKISAEANNLTTALKGQAKTQGNWGEMILESILEQSGLTKDREYFLQQSFRDPAGKLLQPDVLIKLPNNRTIIIDAKVSLIAYDRYVCAATPEIQQLSLKEHLQSMEKHIQQLHGKQYDQLEASLDFTMLFVPIEPAYLLGIQQDPELWSKAYKKRILLISPTNLIACLKLMDDLWKREKQSESAMEIVKRGEKIYEKLVGFSDSLEAVGDHLHKAGRVYDKAVNQFKQGKDNLVSQAIKLKSMGLKSSKEFSVKMTKTEISLESGPESELEQTSTILEKSTAVPDMQDENKQFPKDH